TNGWQASDIEEGFNAIGSGPSPIPTASSPISNVQQSSGFMNPAGDQQDFINKWSWGGFFLYAVYFIASRNYKRAFLYFLGTAVPILNIWLWIKSGLRGRKLVWESGKWQDFESYRKRQKLLDKIGFIWALIIALIWIGSFVFGYFNNSKINTQAEVPFVNQENNQPNSTLNEKLPPILNQKNTETPKPIQPSSPTNQTTPPAQNNSTNLSSLPRMTTDQENQRVNYFFQMFVVARQKKDINKLVNVFGYMEEQAQNFKDEDGYWSYSKYTFFKAVVKTDDGKEKHIKAYYIVPDKNDSSKSNLFIVFGDYTMTGNTAFISQWQVFPTAYSPKQYSNQADIDKEMTTFLKWDLEP
ncbi:MAG: hypothetical protein WCG28_03345, partial [bacterium]